MKKVFLSLLISCFAISALADDAYIPSLNHIHIMKGISLIPGLTSTDDINATTSAVNAASAHIINASLGTASAENINATGTVNAVDLTVSGLMTGSGGISLLGTAGTDQRISMGAVNSIERLGTGELKLQTNASDITLAPAGEVGISSDLTVIGTFSCAKMSHNGSDTLTLQGVNTSDTATIQVYETGNTYLNAYGAGAGEGGFIFRTNDATVTAQTIEPDGDIVMGYDLAVSGTFSAAGISHNGDDTLSLQGTNTSDTLTLQPYSNGNTFISAYGAGGAGEGGFIFRTNNATVTAQTIEPDGDIVMGYDLTVSGTGNFTGALTAASYADNTPSFLGTPEDAASEVLSVKDKDGEIDHSTLGQAHKVVDVTDYFFDVEIDSATVETVEGQYSPEIVDVTQVIPAVEYSIEEALEDSFKTVNKMIDEPYQAEEVYYVTEVLQVPKDIEENTNPLDPIVKTSELKTEEKRVEKTRIVIKTRQVPVISYIKQLPKQLTKSGEIISPTEIVYATTTVVDGKKLKAGIQFQDGKFIKPAKIEKIGTKDKRLEYIAQKHGVKSEDVKIRNRTEVKKEDLRDIGMSISTLYKALQYSLDRIDKLELALSKAGIKVE